MPDGTAPYPTASPTPEDKKEEYTLAFLSSGPGTLVLLDGAMEAVPSTKAIPIEEMARRHYLAELKTQFKKTYYYLLGPELPFTEASTYCTDRATRLILDREAEYYAPAIEKLYEDEAASKGFSPDNYGLLTGSPTGDKVLPIWEYFKPDGFYKVNESYKGFAVCVRDLKSRLEDSYKDFTKAFSEFETIDAGCTSSKNGSDTCRIWKKAEPFFDDLAKNPTVRNFVTSYISAFVDPNASLDKSKFRNLLYSIFDQSKVEGKPLDVKSAFRFINKVNNRQNRNVDAEDLAVLWGAQLMAKASGDTRTGECKGQSVQKTTVDRCAIDSLNNVSTPSLGSNMLARAGVTNAGCNGILDPSDPTLSIVQNTAYKLCSYRHAISLIPLVGPAVDLAAALDTMASGTGIDPFTGEMTGAGYNYGRIALNSLMMTLDVFLVSSALRGTAKLTETAVSEIRSLASGPFRLGKAKAVAERGEKFFKQAREASSLLPSEIIARATSEEKSAAAFAAAMNGFAGTNGFGDLLSISMQTTADAVRVLTDAKVAFQRVKFTSNGDIFQGLHILPSASKNAHPLNAHASFAAMQNGKIVVSPDFLNQRGVVGTVLPERVMILFAEEDPHRSITFFHEWVHFLKVMNAWAGRISSNWSYIKTIHGKAPIPGAPDGYGRFFAIDEISAVFAELTALTKELSLSKAWKAGHPEHDTYLAYRDYLYELGDRMTAFAGSSKEFVEGALGAGNALKFESAAYLPQTGAHNAYIFGLYEKGGHQFSFPVGVTSQSLSASDTSKLAAMASDVLTPMKRELEQLEIHTKGLKILLNQVKTAEELGNANARLNGFTRLEKALQQYDEAFAGTSIPVPLR